MSDSVKKVTRPKANIENPEYRKAVLELLEGLRGAGVSKFASADFDVEFWPAIIDGPSLSERVEDYNNAIKGDADSDDDSVIDWST